MGRVLNMKKQGMSWLLKTGQVLLLTFLALMFMGDGWYAPNSSSAANVTRYLVNNNGTVISTNEGSTNAATSGTSVTGTTTLAAWRSFFGTAAGATSFNLRITAATTGTWYKLMRFYVSSNYATATQISGTPTYRFGARSTNLTDQYQAYLIDFDPAGAAGNGTVITSTAVINSPNTGTYTEVAGNFTAIATPYTVPAGHRLVLEVRFKPGVAAATGRLAFGSTAAGYNSWIIANETAVATDTTPPTAGTVTVTPTVGTYTSAAPTITTVFTDTQSAVTSCAYTTNNGSTWPAGTVSGTGPYTCTATPTGLTGALTINMRATSTGGTGTATAVTRTVDASAPTNPVLSVTAGNALNTLSWTAASDASGVANYILRFATGPTAPANCTAGTAVPGSPFSAATLATTHSGLTNDTQYSYRLCAADGFGFTSAGTTASATPVAMGGPVITNCAGCHGYKAPQTFADGASRNPSGNGTFPGSHNGHVQTAGMACAVCHTSPASEESADFDHADRTVQMASPLSGGSYGRGSFTVTNNVSPSTCNATTCHGTASPTWGNNTTNAACTKCHGVLGTTPAQYSANNKTAAPGYVSTAPVGTGRDTGGATDANDAEVGAHNVHLAAAPNYSAPMACNVCHKDVNPNSATFTGHMNGTGTVVFFGLATTNHPVNPTYNGTNCTNTYCHFGKSIGGYAPATANASVAWTNTSYLAFGTPTLAGDCSKCHLSPPSSTGMHTSGMLIGSCNGCHPHVNADGTFNNKSLHINGIVEGASSCVECHTLAKGTRAAVVDEFGRAWGHKKTGRGAVTDSDCIVCHLEGAFTTQKPSAYHMDGSIDLRDPDGAGETRITNNSGVSFTFTKYAISYAAGSRTSTLGNTIPEVVTVKFCMACHDSNGATNPYALTRNATNTATTGTARMPFGGVALGAGYVAANNAVGAQGLIDVKTQFAATNSSRHPVGAPNNRAFPTSARLVAPYNIPTGRNSNTTASNGTGTRVLANSAILVCDDCHTTVTPVTTRTITAHGNDATVRGTFYLATGGTLCLTCHIGTYNDTTAGNHRAGSAFGTSVTRPRAALNTCQFCHTSWAGPYNVANRPRTATDVHGFNSMYNTTGGWTYGNANGMRPIAFLRNNGSFPTTSWRPYVATVAGPGQFNLAAGQATCGGNGSFPASNGGTISCSNQGHTSYGPGGSY